MASSIEYTMSLAVEARSSMRSRCAPLTAPPIIELAAGVPSHVHNSPNGPRRQTAACRIPEDSGQDRQTRQDE